MKREARKPRRALSPDLVGTARGMLHVYIEACVRTRKSVPVLVETAYERLCAVSPTSDTEAKLRVAVAALKRAARLLREPGSEELCLSEIGTALSRIAPKKGRGR